MSIKNLAYYLCMFVAVSTLIFTTSCKGDDEVVIDDVEGINVADGWYMASPGIDPTTADELSTESVNQKDFGSQDRAGFNGGYVWLNATSYNLVKIVDKAITSTLGGTPGTGNDPTESSCMLDDYTTVTGIADGGAAFTVATAGLYKVTYDETTSEIVLYNITKPNIIGSGTPGGWGTDTEFTKTSLDATGGVWQATNVELREGEWKIRFNCRWSIDRRTSVLDPTNVTLDPDDPYDPAKGYVLFTNYGGAANDLKPGNDASNIPILESEEGLYTFDVTWDGATGDWAVALTKTGDVAPITFVPDEHQWALTGDATPNGWADDDMSNDPIGVDHDFNYEGVAAGTYTWELTEIALIPGAFKFRANDLWDENLGWGQITLTGDTSDFSDDGGNIKVGTAASYRIVMTTSDDGDSYTADFTQL